MSGDSNRSDSRLEYHKLVLEGLQKGQESLTTEVRSYRQETTVFAADLQAHVKSCDRRYLEMKEAKEAKESPESALVRKTPWVIRKMADKAMDYGFFIVLFLIYYAIEHGGLHHIPGPTP